MKPLPKELFGQLGFGDDVNISDEDGFDTLVTKFVLMSEDDFQYSWELFHEFVEAMRDAAEFRKGMNSTVH